MWVERYLTFSFFFIFVWKFLKKEWTFSPDAEKYYNFTELACQLNEPEESVCPTDSRNRPDQRLMEDGRWEEANSEKLRLEEKQRATRRRREAEAEQAASEGKNNQYQSFIL